MNDRAEDRFGHPAALNRPLPTTSRLSRLVSRFDAWDVATGCVLVVLLVLVAKTFCAYGVSNDEWVQHHYGELIVRYYQSGFTDRALFSFENLYLYGGLFDVAAVLLHKIVPLELYNLRHLMTALIGTGGVGIVALMARRIAGARAGFLAAVGLAVSGAWYGTMFTHTKDVPLAAAMAGAGYFLLRASSDLPRLKWRDMIGFGVMTGCALGIKSLGLLLPAYAGVAVLIALMRSGEFGVRAMALFIARSAIRFIPALLIAYLIMIAAWPWAALAPLNPIRGLLQFGDFNYPIKTELAGHFYEMGSIPRFYVPIYLAIRNPLVLLFPALLALLLIPLPLWNGGWFTSQRRRDAGFVAFMALFPLACEVISHGPAFSGMRHFTFLLPLIAVLAAVGLEAVLVAARRLHWAAAGAAFAVIMLNIGWTAHTLVELHPYEYLFYNPLVGGLAGASRHYDTDYWVAIMPAAVSDLAAYLKKTDGSKKSPYVYSVDVCGDQKSFERELAVQHLENRLQWTDNWDHADFFVSPTNDNCDELLKGKVIGKIERMGTLIGVVKDRRATTRPAVARLSRQG